MKEIRKILVPTDFSQPSSQAFSYALWMADRTGASIDLLHVVYPGTDVMDFPAMAAQATKVQIETANEVMKAFTDEALTRLQSTTDIANIPVVRSKIEVGAAGPVIAAMAEELNSDLIVIGTRGEHNRFEVAFGSVTTAVVRRSRIPVLVVPEELRAIQIKNVGYATGYDDSDPEHIWDAVQFLSEFQPTLNVVHVRTNEDKYMDIDLRALKSYLDEKGIANRVTYHEIEDEDTEEGLEKFASAQQLDLLIMYSPKRNLFERIGHRSITRKMVLYSTVPLLVIK